MVLILRGLRADWCTLPRRIRLVLDLRSLNSALPSCTVKVAALWQVLCSLRLISPECIGASDVRAAFYAVRLCSDDDAFLKFLKVRTGIGDYVVNRVGFGVSPGPLALVDTLGRAVRSYRASDTSQAGYIVDYLDDVHCFGQALRVVANLARLIYLLSCSAFCSQLKKLGIAAVTEQREIINQALQEYGIDIAAADSVSVFGLDFSYAVVSALHDGDLLTVDCRRTARLTKAPTFFDLEPVLCDSHSKKAFYCVAGLLSFDPCRMHSASRLLADVLRACIGRWFSSTSWDGCCRLSTLSEDDRLAYIELVRWGRLLCEEERGPCRHTTSVMPLTSGDSPAAVTLNVSSDASLYGGGVVICRQLPNGGDETVLTDALRFSPRQTFYSSNRRELLVCLQALRAVSALLDFVRSVATAQDRGLQIKVNFVSDNSSSVSWIGNPEAVLRLQSSKALEKRAIVRLVDAITLEVDAIRTACGEGNFSVSHVSGNANKLADEESRRLDRVVADSNGRSLGLLTSHPKTTSGLLVSDITDHGSTDDSCCSAFDLCDSGTACGFCSTLTEDIIQLGDLSVESDYLNSHKSVLCLQDYCCLVREDPGLPVGDSPDPHCGRLIRSVTDAIFTVRDSLYVASQGTDNSNSVIHYDLFRLWNDDDVLAAAHSAQGGGEVDRSRRPVAASPLQLDGSAAIKDVMTHRCGLPSAHRACKHGNLPFNVGSIKLYHLPTAVRLCKEVLAGCLPCRILRANRTWSAPSGMSSDEQVTVADMFKTPPYTYASCDVLSVGEGCKLLTVQCRASRHICWKHIEHEDTKSIVEALKRVRRTVRGLRYLYADQASYHRSPVFRQRLRDELGCELTLIPRHSPWCGANERHHAVALDMLRQLLRHDAGRIAKLCGPDRQDLYDQVTLLHNGMPMGVYTLQGSAEVAVTRDMLCMGYTRLDSCSTASQVKPSLPWVPYKAYASARNVYLSHMWSHIKKQNSRLHPLPRCDDSHLYFPGAPVLVYNGSPRRLSASFALAHVRERVSTHRISVVHTNGSVTVENLRNVTAIYRCDRDSSSGRAIGASLLHMPLRVWIPDKQGTGDWYYGRVVDHIGDDEVLICWDRRNPDDSEWLRLWQEKWEPLTDSGDMSP
ncbi:hypothetical protein FOZ60_006561 [Perkinsus olseni]|uniref:Uncharacterized protein n=1 Tax=Perkinsus olseni TaxID=32597 RepID=A0A7J6NNQ2_PEROL|nr:hypothetical protein FOZ60_006561 [Perkinsus olseni]